MRSSAAPGSPKGSANSSPGPRRPPCTPTSGRSAGSIWQEKLDRSPRIPAPVGWAGATMPAGPPVIVAHVKNAGQLPEGTHLVA